MSLSSSRGGQVFNLGFLVLLLHGVPAAWSAAPPRTSMDLSLRLNASDTLVSPSGDFELGIFPVDGSYYLCIRYARPIEQVVTWMANRNIPLQETAYLQLTADGNLQLFDPENDKNTVPWATSTANSLVTKAVLLDTGNLVLQDNNSVTLWDSFRNSMSTDTLLPGQYLNRTDSYTLTSWLTQDTNPASTENGTYSFGWGGSNGTTLQLSWTSPKAFANWKGGAYIPAPDVHDAHTVSSVEYVYFHAKLGHLYIASSPADTAILSGGPDEVNATTLKRITIDTDGGFRIWQWTKGVSRTWTAKANWVVSDRPDSRSQCTAYGTCGPYGWCQSAFDSLDRVQCTCPEGFKPSYAEDPARGCTPWVPVNSPDCNDPAKVRMLVLPGVDMPWGGDYRNLTGSDPILCRDTCLHDCNCAGAVFSEMEQTCWLKADPLFNIGYPTVALHGNDRTAFIKVSTTPPPSPSSSSGRARHRVPIVIGSTVGGIFVLVTVWFLTRRYGHRVRRLNCCNRNRGGVVVPGRRPPLP